MFAQSMARDCLSSNLVDLLRDRAQQHPERVAFVFLKDGETEAGHLTYADLDRQAQGIATQLRRLTVPTARALLVYPYEAGLEFIAAFLGCLYAQVIAVPCHPPRNQTGLTDLCGRLTSSESTLVLTTRSLLPQLQRQLNGAVNSTQALYWLTLDDSIGSYTVPEPTWDLPEITSETVAFLQYTSGSTGQPKGVIVTHGSLWHNQRMLQAAFEHTEASIGLGWLPLFHDMGLIGNILQSLYVGLTTILMSPIAFIQKPVRWLAAISHYRATTSGGPCFAYELLCRYVTDQQRDRLDLSSWDVAFCGAEPVRAKTLDRFVEKFQICGFRREAFYPCYGMAEATLFITGGQKTQPPEILQVDTAALEQNQLMCFADAARGAPIEAARTQAIVSCGSPWLESKVVIADPATGTPCAEHQIGEIWVSGAGVGPGYWHPLEPNHSNTPFAAVLTTGEGGFLRTGDLGFLHHNELFVTGRLHDVMVFWGFNHYPQQIEQTVEACHPAFRANGCAAFSAVTNGEDRLMIAQEVERRYRDRLILQDVLETVRWRVFQAHFLDVGTIMLLKPGRLPRTSSGKVQRHRCKQQFLDGSLEPLEIWQSLEQSDIPSLMRRNLNPLTHLRRYRTRLQGQLWQHLRS